MDFRGLKIVVDASHGAGYKVAPRVIAELGAEVIPVGCSPNGRNINDGCGSMRPDLLQLTVTGVRAHVGIALDGDGDRVVMVDERGNLVDGDQLLYVLACDRHATGQLSGPCRRDRYDQPRARACAASWVSDFFGRKCGDRHVSGDARENDGMLGGEASGHLLCLDKTTTGDGLITALQVLAIIRRTGRSLSELAGSMPQMPQTMLNVQVATKVDVSAHSSIAAAVTSAETKLGERGRVVLRASGTEPVIRVMVEGEDQVMVRALAAELAESVRSAVG